MVRQRTLTPSFPGSNPGSAAVKPQRIRLLWGFPHCDKVFNKVSILSFTNIDSQMYSQRLGYLI